MASNKTYSVLVTVGRKDEARAIGCTTPRTAHSTVRRIAWTEAEKSGKVVSVSLMDPKGELVLTYSVKGDEATIEHAA